ncbi:Predicted flavoprotein CzcO associated with the cation diffusion facilitator CzcD [Microbulbifer donghaiensis]|uniref:Predicted flavoprotein CzcO associated with the cation diffusion facilitator CzcD n=1 Tax=Microbulbifer donghaiensis TaxID=494016 RepID=A0A1M5GLT2_9GAMM|nr:NAD(P)-binding domain-containing protein [Microbulbifer donghaiensis]SHG04674.1 Predicted flavoprotein CzcO associated with the cation diffusion facilitator CzcD [Microbulbifer donghaiensis]
MKPYAVIGAGPMGLCSVRNLVKYGIPCVGFEIHSDVGGLWDIDSPTSTMYESAHLISSKKMTEFAEFPMGEEVAQFPHHSELRDYFRAYAREFGLYERYEFNTEVVHCERDGDDWRITTRVVSGSRAGEEQTRTFGGLLIANGTLHHPNMAELPGEFAGELLHSCDYRDPAIFEGKRVLLVGCGNSGADIAVDAVHRARSVDISLRRGYYFLPKFIGGKPTDAVGGKVKLPRFIQQRISAALSRFMLGRPSQYGLPEPDYKMFESHPVINSLILHHIGHGDIRPQGDVVSIDGNEVTFKDGRSGEYDMILLATGYKLNYPFIGSAELNWTGYAPRLYLNVFHPETDNLFLMGMVEAAGLGWEGRNEQAELVALYISQLASGADSARRFQATKHERASQRADGGMKYLELERMAYYVHKDTYLKALRSHSADLRKDLATRDTAQLISSAGAA